MKKIICVFTLLIVFLSFTSCGNINATTTEHTISFADENGNVFETISIKKGEEVEYPEITKEEGYDYSWNATLDEISNTDSDLFVMIVKKESTKVVKYYIDDKIVKQEETGYFKKVSEPNVPRRYANYSWEKHVEIRDNIYYVTYSLKYDYAKFAIKYFDGYEELDLQPNNFEYGTGTTLPIYNKEGMVFVGWFLSDISMTRYTEIEGDTEHEVRLYARFVSIEPDTILSLGDYTYQFEELQRIPIANYPNAITTNPVIPADAPQGATQYDWTSEDQTIALVSEYSSIRGIREGYTIIKGVHKLKPEIIIKGIIHVTANGIKMASLEEANKREMCEVTFVDEDNTVISKQKIVKGDHVLPPTPPVHNGKAFDGWDHQLYDITEDTTIMATYTQGTNKYAGKKIAIIGDSISTYLNVIPNWFSVFYPYASGDIYDFYQTWWMRVINRLGGSLFVNNSYSGSFVSGNANSASTSDGRLAELIINGEKPDVIIIFMGTNDIGSPVPAYKFEYAYREMLRKVNALCPKAELVLCSLPTGVLYTKESQAEYLAAIRSCSYEYNATLVDLTDVDLKNALIDRVHPNRNGMELIANKVIEVMLSNTTM